MVNAGKPFERWVSALMSGASTPQLAREKVIAIVMIFPKKKDCRMTRQVINVSDRALAVDINGDFYGLLKPLGLQAPLQALRFFLLAATVKLDVGQTLRA